MKLVFPLQSAQLEKLKRQRFEKKLQAQDRQRYQSYKKAQNQAELSIQAFANKLGMPNDQIKFISGNTAYLDSLDVLLVGTDIMPAGVLWVWGLEPLTSGSAGKKL